MGRLPLRMQATVQVDCPSPGFTDSSHLFGQILEQVLEKFILDLHMCLLQYVDDLLLSG
jgi:hypothetical protein